MWGMIRRRVRFCSGHLQGAQHARSHHRGGTIIDGTAHRDMSPTLRSTRHISAIGTGSATRPKHSMHGLIVTPASSQSTPTTTARPVGHVARTVERPRRHTVVAGNCGVGFAPVRPGKEEWLVQLMEGVEDIPHRAARGISWGWESFPEYSTCRRTQLFDRHRTYIGHGRCAPT